MERSIECTQSSFFYLVLLEQKTIPSHSKGKKMEKKDNLAGVVEDSSTCTSERKHPASIRMRPFAKIITKLYEAIIRQEGLYATVTMETHAPQIKYYPGSPALVPKETNNPNQQEFFHKDAVVVVKKIPDVVWKTGIEHRRWLWFAVHGDTQDVSEQVYPTHCRLAADHPEIYTEQVLNINFEKLVSIFKERHPNGKRKYKITEPELSAKEWKICATTLFCNFEGDPVKLLQANGWSALTTYKWKAKHEKEFGYDPIPGWGIKLISLYFLYLADIGFLPLPEDAFPADLHAQALPQQLGLLDWGGVDYIYSSKMAELVRVAVTEVCNKKGYDVIILAHAKWLLGSYLCNGCASNKQVPNLCPVYKECCGRLDTGSYTSGIWLKSNLFHTKSGERPKFGIPTDFPRRLYRRKKAVIKEESIPKTIPLFQI